MYLCISSEAVIVACNVLIIINNQFMLAHSDISSIKPLKLEHQHASSDYLAAQDYILHTAHASRVHQELAA